MSLRPTSTEELAGWLADLPAGTRVVPRGLGGNLGVTPASAEIVDTTGLVGIDHRRDDFNVSVGAGVPFGELTKVLADAGQRIAIDPPVEGTVGAMLATSARGALVARYGGIRDLVIGATVVLGDGTIAHSGGRVIKNVAGYDLAKLFVGARGMFGIVTEVVLRCHPLPQARRVVRGSVAPDQLPDTLARLAASGADPVGVEWSGGVLAVLCEGTPEAVEADAGKLATALPGASEAPVELLRDFGSVQRPVPGGAVLGVSVRSANIPAVLARLEGLGVAGDHVLGHVATGILEVNVGPSGVPEVLEGLAKDPGAPRPRVRLELRALGEGAVVPPAIVADLEPVPSVVGRLSDALDPFGRFKQGRWDVGDA